MLPWITPTDVTPVGMVMVRVWVAPISRYPCPNGVHAHAEATGEPATVTRESLGKMNPSPGFCARVRCAAPKNARSCAHAPLTIAVALVVPVVLSAPVPHMIESPATTTGTTCWVASASATRHLRRCAGAYSRGRGSKPGPAFAACKACTAATAVGLLVVITSPAWARTWVIRPSMSATLFMSPDGLPAKG